jgi:Tol biopolymer transport system component
MAADGSGVTRLTNDAVLDTDPAWSPDGTKIVWTRHQFRPELLIMDADGTNETPLVRGSQPSWSPDGSRIAFQGADGRIQVINPDGTGDLQLTTGTPGVEIDETPNWSPDGTRIAFGRRTFVTICSPPRCTTVDLSDVYVMSADGTGVQRLTPAEGPESHRLNCCPAWSPDGSRIAFSATFGDLATIDPDGGGLTTVIPVASSPSGFSVEPDWQPLPVTPAPEGKNRAQRCKGERARIGDDAFREKYGGGGNAFGRCVSGHGGG